jgi:hypothetical protein
LRATIKAAAARTGRTASRHSYASNGLDSRRHRRRRRHGAQKSRTSVNARGKNESVNTTDTNTDTMKPRGNRTPEGTNISQIHVTSSSAASILTYEEVSLYLSRARRKRPVVLVARERQQRPHLPAHAEGHGEVHFQYFYFYFFSKLLKSIDVS